MWHLRAIVVVAGMALAKITWAGEGYIMYVVAATPDGTYQAIQEEDGRGQRCEFGPVDPSRTKTVPVAAVCRGENPNEIWPIDKWRWEKSVPEMRRLRPFADKEPWNTARIKQDEDTGVHRLEILRDKSWITVRVIEGDAPGITGVMLTPTGFLLRARYVGNLHEYDEVWTVSQRELDEAPRRWEQARTHAREATARMREHRAHGTGVFAPAPAGTAKAKWEQRRRHGIAKFIHDWEIAAAYGALTAPEAQDALWLLGWFDSPPRRYEALRWYGGLLDRDAGAAKEVLERLAADPDTRALADFLRSTPDPLRNLPLVINDETLRPLSDEQVHWIHRAVRAWLGYRFSEPTVAAYFALRPDYTPYSEKRWRRMLKESRGSPDAILLRAPNPDLRLQSVVREEQRRGIGAPPL